MNTINKATRRLLVTSVPRRGATTSQAALTVAASTTTHQQGAGPAATSLLSCLTLSTLFLATSSATIVNTACENDAQQRTRRASNPLATGALSEQDVDELVDSILQDPKMNIRLLPDYLERQIYKSTIQLTLAAVYDSIGYAHGMQMLNHEIQLTRIKDPTTKEQTLQKMRTYMDDEVLEVVADTLLANKYVNLALVPDVIERQLYVNCLKLVFRTLDILASSFRLTVCGHIFGFSVHRSTRQDIAQQAAQRASSAAALTEIDMEVLKQYARQVGVNDEHATEMNWWQKLVDRPSKEFVTQIHVSLYGLVLAIIDDLFANTQLEVLSDRIEFDLVPSSSEGTDASGSVSGDENNNTSESTHAPPTNETNAPSSKVLPLGTFLAGLGIGVAVSSALLSPPRA